MSFPKKRRSVYQKRNNSKKEKQLLWVSRCPSVRLAGNDHRDPPARRAWNGSGKAPFPVSFFYRRLGNSGSMSLELALVLPLFLFFCINVLTLLLSYEAYGVQLMQVHQTGRQLAVAAYTGAEQEGEKTIVELGGVVRIKPLFTAIVFPKRYVTTRCYLHKWTGYDPAEDADTREEEELVYVTENGTVYHRDAGCTHLQLTIQPVLISQAEASRNRNGEKYKSCEICEKRSGISGSTVYITREGNRYHSSLACSGLKRTIYVIPLSQAEGKRPCSRCANR